MFFAKDEVKKVAVVDQSGIVMPYLQNSDLVEYSDCSGQDVEKMKAEYAGAGMDILLVVSPVDSVAKTVYVSSYSQKPLSVELKERIASRASEAVEDYRISLYDMGDLKQIMKDVEADVEVSTYTMDNETGEEK